MSVTLDVGWLLVGFNSVSSFLRSSSPPAPAESTSYCGMVQPVASVSSAVLGSLDLGPGSKNQPFMVPAFVFEKDEKKAKMH